MIKIKKGESQSCSFTSAPEMPPFVGSEQDHRPGHQYSCQKRMKNYKKLLKLIKNKTFGLKFWSILQFISTVNIAKVKIICHVNCEPCQNMRSVPTSFELCSHMLRWQRKFFFGDICFCTMQFPRSITQAFPFAVFWPFI